MTANDPVGFQMIETYRYLHYDVFTNRRFAGNQLAVLPDARGLDGERMQRIAAEMAFSETTFVLPAEDAASDARMRIFTPGAELPMAGHPTVGSTFALAHEGMIDPERRRFTFSLGVGPTPVELEWADGVLAFVWMIQPLPELGAVVDDRGGLAAVLGVEESEVGFADLRAQVVSSGVPVLFVPLSRRAAVDASVLDRVALRRLLESAGGEELPVFVFSLERSEDDDATVYARMFAPTFGIIEDPATGGASGPLGAYLVQRGAVPPARAGEIVSRQGVAMGRPSRIRIAIDVERGEIVRVRVGGEAVLVAEGTLLV